MTAIELMLEALKNTQSTLKQLTLENSPLYQMNSEAIAAGEAELRREPDFWIQTLTGDGYYCVCKYPAGDENAWTSTPLWEREEIK